MNNDGYGMRRPMGNRYPEKNSNYSPSTSFNYNPQSGYNNNNQQGGVRRRPMDRMRRDNYPNVNERIIRQNDIIIRLLKEIRDRLPATVYNSAPAADTADAHVIAPPVQDQWQQDEQHSDAEDHRQPDLDPEAVAEELAHEGDLQDESNSPQGNEQ
jgi:hypothetical protein